MAGDGREELARGLEHLQAAAREAIRATRSLLDAAEELIDDPGAVGEAVASLATVVQRAVTSLCAEGAGSPPSSGEPASRQDQVERIRVS